MKIRINPNSWWDWLAAAFLGMAIFAVATRLSVTHWTESLGRVQLMTVIGMIIGMLLGISQFSSRLVRVLGFGYAAFLVPWIVVADQSSGSIWSDRVLEGRSSNPSSRKGALS